MCVCVYVCMCVCVCVCVWSSYMIERKSIYVGNICFNKFGPLCVFIFSVNTSMKSCIQVKTMTFEHNRTLYYF